MPKIILTEQQRIEERVVCNIRALGAKNGCRYNEDIAKRVHIPVSTFNDKMNVPRRFKLEDFSQIARAFKVPIAKIFEEV